MAPPLVNRDQIIGCKPHAPKPSVSAETSGIIWIIPIIITGTASLSIIFIVFLVRRRRKATQYSRAREKDPALSWTDFSRRWKMSADQRQEEDEIQRITQIRKALA